MRLEGLEDNTDVFHHLLIYLREDPALLGEIVPCTSNQNRGRIALQSSTPWLGHLPGGQPLDFPPQAGYPVGTKLKYGILELHYDNPEGLQVTFALTPKVSDVTGFRVFLTTTKRQHDVGHILIGINHGSLRMPHGIKAAHQSGGPYPADPQRATRPARQNKSSTSSPLWLTCTSVAGRRGPSGNGKTKRLASGSRWAGWPRWATS